MWIADGKPKSVLSGGITVTNTSQACVNALKAVNAKNISPDADAVFISCTGMRTIPIIETLEADLKKPVISAVQASMWYALKVLGINDLVPGTGSLFAV